MNMKNLRVGIAFEGGDDGELIAAIVRKALAPYGYTFEQFNPETPGTVILDFISAYVSRFIDMDVDIGIFCTDQDNSRESRRRCIRERIESANATFLDKAVIGVPVPHIEAWLLAQDSVVKNILGIDGSVPLGHSDLSPKDRLTALYAESKSYEGSRNDLRIEIARNLDIDICCRQSPDFESFIQDIRSIANRLP
jgi:hypothetical protein